MKTISVVIPNLNDEENLEKCLISLQKQNYAKDLIEIIVVDGGSKDKSIDIAEKYGAKVIIDKNCRAEGAKGIGISKAKGELILLLDSDNVLPFENWLLKLEEILEVEKEAIAVYPLRYKVRKKDKILNRYFALFGVNDPVAYFLKKADRQDYLDGKYKLTGKIIKEEKDYYLIAFDKWKIPTLGANGFLVKKEILNKSKYRGKNFYHIDSNLDLVNKGYAKYAVAKTDIIHASGENLRYYLQRRLKYFDQFYARDFKNRDFKMFEAKKDFWRLAWFGITSLTIIFPLYQSVKGYFKKQDLAWFLHPIICFLMLFVYTWAVFKNWLRKLS